MSVENLFRQPLALNVADATTSVRVLDVADSPDGALVATQGSLALNRFPAQLWQNVDGLATWSLLATLDTPLGGDLTGTLDHAWVTGIQGVPIDAAAPVNGDVLIFNGVLGLWEHTSLTFGGGPPSGPAGGSLAGLYPNPTLSAVGTAGTYGSASSVPVLTTTAEGRVSVVTPTTIAIAQSQVTDLVTDLGLKADEAITISAGAGLSGGGDLTANRTISMPNVGTAAAYGSATQVPVLTTDAQGRVTGVVNTTISGVVPGGAAGGDLTGTYPSPTLAAAGTAGTYGSSTAVPVLTTDSKGRVTGVTNTPITFPTPPSMAYPKLGNVAVVDAVNGNDGTGAINGGPFLTIPAAIAAIGLSTYITIWVLPGSYALSAGITIPATCSLRGMNTQAVRISWAASVPGGTATLLTLGENTRIEDVTLSLTSANATTSLVGISAPGTTMNTAKLRTITLAVDNSGVATGSTTTVTGILSSGTSSITPAEFSANFTRGVTISVLSNGGGNKRAILVSGPNAVSLRDTNFYVAPPTDPLSTGSYVAAETANDLAQAAFRSCSLSGPTTAGSYTGSDVLQTLPVARDTYGIVIGPGTDLIHRTTQGTPFALTTTPAIMAYAINAVLAGGTRYLWPGVLPTGGDLTPVWFRLDRVMVVQGLSINMLNPPGVGHNVVFTVCKNTTSVGAGNATAMTVTVSDTATTGIDLTHAVTFLAGEYIALRAVRSDAGAEDILVQVDIY